MYIHIYIYIRIHNHNIENFSTLKAYPDSNIELLSFLPILTPDTGGLELNGCGTNTLLHTHNGNHCEIERWIRDSALPSILED